MESNAAPSGRSRPQVGDRLLRMLEQVMASVGQLMFREANAVIKKMILSDGEQRVSRQNANVGLLSRTGRALGYIVEGEAAYFQMQFLRNVDVRHTPSPGRHWFKRDDSCAMGYQ